MKSLMLGVALLCSFLTYAQDAQPPTKLITANGIQLEYQDWGGKGEVILLLAGAGNEVSTS